MRYEFTLHYRGPLSSNGGREHTQNRLGQCKGYLCGEGQFLAGG